MRRDTARYLLALTVLLVPWEYRAIRTIGWGLTFPFGVYIDTNLAQPVGGDQFRTIVTELGLIGQYDPTSRIGLVLWAVAAVLAVAGSLLTVLYVHRGPWTERRFMLVAGAYGVAGALFVVSRFTMYTYLLYSPPGRPNWFSVPVGGIYLVVVGAIFYWWARRAREPGSDAGGPAEGAGEGA